MGRSGVWEGEGAQDDKKYERETLQKLIQFSPKRLLPVSKDQLETAKWTKPSLEKHEQDSSIQFHYSTFNYLPNLGLLHALIKMDTI